MGALYESDQVLKIPAYGDSIINVQAKAVPFLKLVPRGKNPGNFLSEWPVENYPRRGITGQIDGTDKTTFSSVSPTPLSGRAQWCLSDGWMVGKKATVTNTAGTPAKGQKARQILKDGEAFILAINRLLLSAQEAQVESKPLKADLTRGAFMWMSRTAQTVYPVPEAFRPASGCAYTGAVASYANTHMKAQLAAAFTAKNGPVDLTNFVGVTLKGQMSTWSEKVSVSSEAALMQFNQDAKSKKYINTVDIFEFDAGIVRNILTPDLRCTLSDGSTTDYTARSGLGLDLSMWELCYLEEITPFEEAPKSGGPRGYSSAILILKCKNPLGQIINESST
jgi:hypothetical protein